MIPIQIKDKRLVFTVITKNRLAYARVLALSLKEHNPDLTLYVLLADRIEGQFDPSEEPFELIEVEQLPYQEDIRRMSFYYNAFEFCNGVRGIFHDYLVNHTNVQEWIYLDCDIQVFASLAPLFDRLKEYPILLSGHCTTPVDLKYSFPHEINFLNAGVYNSGFLGIRRCPEAAKFIQWFKDRLVWYSFNDLDIWQPRALFIDQKWLNLVPFYFENVGILDDPGANIGPWNLYEKKLAKEKNGLICVNGKPLTFVHFSGFEIKGEYNVCAYAPMYEDFHLPLWDELANNYAHVLYDNGLKETIELPYAFNYFSNGQGITRVMRRTYYDKWYFNKEEVENPFDQFEYFKGKNLTRTFSTKRSLFMYLKEFEEYHKKVEKMFSDLEVNNSQQEEHIKDLLASIEPREKYIVQQEKYANDLVAKIEPQKEYIARVEVELEEKQKYINRMQGDIELLYGTIETIKKTFAFRIQSFVSKCLEAFLNFLKKYG